MYDVSKLLSEFYTDYVVLPRDKQNDLRKKKDLNIKRLKAGLEEYNKEHNTCFKIAESRVQGSMAMHTTVQNDSNDYDIDVAIIFDKDNLNGIGPGVIKNVIVDSLKRKCTGFSKQPYKKTNCVRIEYTDGYHVDFAIYQRFKENENDTDYKYEHAGYYWTSRNPAAINNWFSERIAENGQILRKVIRLSKMFCKSRESWINMPGGLLQTVVCDEKLQIYDRLDEAFYYTMVEIKNRLEDSIEVYNPTDTSIPLLLTEPHRQKMTNWKNRLESQLKNLDILFSSDCTKQNAIDAWGSFFNHDYWSNKAIVAESNFSRKIAYSYDNTEEFIEDLYNMDEYGTVKIKCTISRRGFSPQNLSDFLKSYHRWLPHGYSIECSVGSTNNLDYDLLLWKVRNVGELAEKKNMIRGQIQKRASTIFETSSFHGSHYIECYLIKRNNCIAVGHIDIPIGFE
jgi:hypothetical protein